jgi:hypothetical protein
VVDSAAVAVFGLTGPFILFALPLLLWRSVRTRNVAAWMTAVLGAVITGLQCRAYLASQPTHLPGAAPKLAEFLAAAGYRTGCQLFGLMSSPFLAHTTRWGIVGLALYALLWLLFPLRGMGGDLRPPLAWFSACLVAGGFLRYFGLPHLFFEPVYIARYFYVPLLVGIWLLISGFQSAGLRRWLATISVAAAIACNAGSFRMAPYIDLRWPYYASAIARGEAIQVPINPPPWIFENPGRPNSK